MKRTLIAGLFVGGLLFAAMFWLGANSERLAGLPDVVQAADEPPLVRTAEAAVDESSKDRTPSGHLVEVEFVFFQDKARRAVTGLVVHSTADWSLIAVESSASRAPEGLAAIDRVWMTDRDGRRLPMRYIPFTERTAKTRIEFYRVNAPRPVLPIAELPADLKAGTSLTAVSLKLKPDLEQRERVEAVTFKSVASRELSKDWRLQRGRGKFEEPVPVLIELNRPVTGPLAAGTPLFLKDECVGIAIETAEIQGPDRNRSFALLAAPIKEVLAEVIEKAEAIEPLAPTKALTSPPKLPSIAKTAAQEPPETKKLVSLSEALVPIMLAAEKEAEQPNATEDQKVMAKRYRERRERLQAGQFKDVYAGLYDKPQFVHPSLGVVSTILNRIEGAKDEDHLRNVEVRLEAAWESLRGMYHRLVYLEFDEALEWIRFLDSLEEPKHQPERELVAELVNLDAARRERTANPQPIAQLARKFHSQLDSGELNGLGTLVGQALRQAPDSVEAERMQLRLVMRLAFLKDDPWLQQELSGDLAARFVSAARRRLALGDVAAARLLATDALPVNIRFQSEGDTPSRVLADIEASRPSVAQRNPTSLASTQDSPAATRVANEFDAGMDRDTKQLALRVRAAQEPEKSKLRSQLEKLTEQHFEHRQSRRDAEIAELSDRVDKLRVAQHRRQENKADIIKRRVAELLDPDKKLEWDEANVQSTAPVTTARRDGTITNAAGAPKKAILPKHSATQPEVELNVQSEPNTKSDTVTAALVRVAMARCELAEAEVRAADQTLSIALKSNQEVPGAVPTFEIGKLELNVARRRAEFKVVLAELEAAKAGVDIARTNKLKPASNDEPTYNNVTLSEWLHRLENERNPEKLAEAVLAMTHLGSECDPRKLVQATIQMTRTHVMRQSDITSFKIEFGTLSILGNSKSEIVVDRLIDELEKGENGNLSAYFRFIVARLFHELARQEHGLLWPVNDPIPTVSNDAAKSLRLELRKFARPLITAIMKAAKRDEQLGDWALECASHLQKISDQSLTTYPDLTPLVERVFEDEKSAQQFTAALLLAESRLRISDVIALAEKRLAAPESRQAPHDIAIKILSAVAPQSPQAVAVLVATLRKDIESAPKLFDPTKHALPVRVLHLVAALEQLGPIARDALPVLRQLQESPIAGAVRFSFGSGLGQSYVESSPLSEKVAAAIQAIEEDRQKPKREQPATSTPDTRR